MLPQYGQIIVKNLVNRRFGQIVVIEDSTKPTYGQVIIRRIDES